MHSFVKEIVNLLIVTIHSNQVVYNGLSTLATRDMSGTSWLQYNSTTNPPTSQNLGIC